MKKAWRNHRQVIIHEAPAEQEDAQRLERLISLLATGMERLLAEQTKNIPSESVDFTAKVLPNTDTVNETTTTESK
jgi:hypothetical protein